VKRPTKLVATQRRLAAVEWALVKSYETCAQLQADLAGMGPSVVRLRELGAQLLQLHVALEALAGRLRTPEALFPVLRSVEAMVELATGVKSTVPYRERALAVDPSSLAGVGSQGAVAPPHTTEDLERIEAQVMDGPPGPLEVAQAFRSAGVVVERVPSRCPLCGSEVVAGYGMMGGGCGRYWVCDGEGCPYFAKQQDAGPNDDKPHPIVEWREAPPVTGLGEILSWKKKGATP
jgi:hypothetical protein